MADQRSKDKKTTRICLLGVSFDTGNMGVSALAESSIKLIVTRWPDAEVTLLGTGTSEGEKCLVISGRRVRVRTMRLRFCKNIFLRSHCLVLLVNAALIKLLPLRGVRNLLSRFNPYVKMLLETDKVFDITGGDSFSDIYGMRRFLIFGFLQKWLVTLYGKELVLLPQTYGPWNRPVTRLLARMILRRSGIVYARDRAGIRYVKGLIGNHGSNGKVRFMPDVAFVLDPREPDVIDVGRLTEARKEDSIVVGLNVSALLFNGGYTRDNMFGLQVDYANLVYSIVESIMKDSRVLVLMVPHVFTPDRPVEDDPTVCAQVHGKLGERFPGRVFLARGQYNHAEIKYIIGLCQFFVGSRMHACIAALSQCIPAVGLAYSKKFRGVFRSVGVEDCVADAYLCSIEEALSITRTAYERRKQIKAHLERVIPQVRKQMLEAFVAEDTVTVARTAVEPVGYYTVDGLTDHETFERSRQ